MANALNIHSPEDLDRNRYAQQAADIIENRGGSINGVLTGVRSRPERPVQQYEDGWIVTYEDMAAYITGLTLCEPDAFWDADPDPVTATVFFPSTAETPQQQYDRARHLEETYRDPHLSDEYRTTVLDTYNATFLTAVPDTEESLQELFAHLAEDDRNSDARHVQLGERYWSRFDRPTASELLSE